MHNLLASVVATKIIKITWQAKKKQANSLLYKMFFIRGLSKCLQLILERSCLHIVAIVSSCSRVLGLS